MLRGVELPKGGAVTDALARRRAFDNTGFPEDAASVRELPATRVPVLRSLTSFLQMILRTYLQTMTKHRDDNPALMNAFASVALDEFKPLFRERDHAQLTRVTRACLCSSSATSYSLEWLARHLCQDDRNYDWCCA